MPVVLYPGCTLLDVDLGPENGFLRLPALDTRLRARSWIANAAFNCACARGEIGFGCSSIINQNYVIQPVEYFTFRLSDADAESTRPCLSW